MRWSAVTPYVVLVVAIPALTVVAGIVTFWIAIAEPAATAAEPVIKRDLAVIQPPSSSAERIERNRP